MSEPFAVTCAHAFGHFAWMLATIASASWSLVSAVSPVTLAPSTFAATRSPSDATESDESTALSAVSVLPVRSPRTQAPEPSKEPNRITVVRRIRSEPPDRPIQQRRCQRNPADRRRPVVRLHAAARRARGTARYQSARDELDPIAERVVDVA